MLHIQNLQAGYDGKAIVTIADFTIDTGEHALILGKSGGGKTTLLYALAGLLQSISGALTLDGMNMLPMSDQFRGKHIGIIYQTLHMIPALSILENLLLVPYANGTMPDISKAEYLLDRLGLSEMRHRKPDTLSQGQQQRVAIARAAMQSPKIILGDEPTSALDDEACENVMRLLLDIANSSGSSLVIATHDARIKRHFSKIITLGAAL